MSRIIRGYKIDVLDSKPEILGATLHNTSYVHAKIIHHSRKVADVYFNKNLGSQKTETTVFFYNNTQGKKFYKKAAKYFINKTPGDDNLMNLAAELMVREYLNKTHRSKLFDSILSGTLFGFSFREE